MTRPFISVKRKSGTRSTPGTENTPPRWFTSPCGQDGVVACRRFSLHCALLTFRTLPVRWFAHDKTRGLFIGGPGRRKAARGHSISFWRLAPFPFAGLPVVAGDTRLIISSRQRLRVTMKAVR
jgi:hypothetical protein